MPRDRRSAPPPPSGSAGEPDEDRRLWEQALLGVRPLPAGPPRVSPATAPAPDPAPRATSPASPSPRGATGAARPAGDVLHVEVTGEHVEGWRPGVPRDRVRALRAGDPPPERTVDLHGATRDEAVRRLTALVREARAAGRRCLRVVHGRGLRSGPDGPVLRTVVTETLARPPLSDGITAFATAPARLGGPGALLVLLRRSG